MNLDINELIEVSQRLFVLLEQAETDGLRIRIIDLQNPDLIRQAHDLLVSDAPLHPDYPDGSSADPPFTPRQVLSLAEDRFEHITHTDERYRVAREEVWAELGRHHRRRCRWLEYTPSQCQGWALAYTEEPLCRQHASPGAALLNRRMLDQEAELLKQRLDKEQS